MPNAVTMNSGDRAFIDIPLVTVCAMLPLVWIRIAQAGPLAVKPVHFALALIAISLLLSRDTGESIYRLLSSSWKFLLAYLIYLSTLALSLMWTDSQWIGWGLAYIAKQVLLAVFAVVVGARLASLKANRLPATLLCGGAAAYLTAMFAAFVAFSRIGDNALTQYISYIVSGNWLAINYEFFPTLFSGFTYDNTYETLPTMKHDVSNGLFVGFVLFQIGARTLMNSHKLRTPYAVALVAISIVMFIVLVTTFSRSTIAALFVAIGVVLLIRLSGSSEHKMTPMKILYSVGFLLMIAVVWMTLGGTLIDYFVGETSSYSQRLNTYNLAIDALEKNTFLGVGMGGLIASDAVHNFFLRAWYHAGAPALTAAILFYLYAMGHWVSTIIRHLRDPDSWLLPLEAAWVFALPALPLVRTLFTATDFILSQWICFAVYFAILSVNNATGISDKHISSRSSTVRT